MHLCLETTLHGFKRKELSMLPDGLVHRKTEYQLSMTHAGNAHALNIHQRHPGHVVRGRRRQRNSNVLDAPYLVSDPSDDFKKKR
ncbi:hypothetical protein DPMN_155095 [Dreissena polymorpha]|uniref:Uncharacterized protein n=1 Tax=Dreissena polymorpha TaxID=45954 RepID=A0A9D4FLP1_DREPO|nr:hypothetical protein DPMN_155095 [Dreissena polymorpha]